MRPLPLTERPLRGIGLMLVAYLLFTCIDTCAKWLVLSGLAPFQVAFVRFSVHAGLVLALFWPWRGRSLFATAAPGLEGLRALCLMGSTAFNFTAVQYLPLTLTVTVFFTTPLWVCALSVPFLGETVGLRRWSAIAVGFSGVLIAARPWAAEAHWAVLLSVGAAVSAAFYALLTRRLAGVDRTETQQFYAALVAAMAIGAMALPGIGDWRWPAAAPDWMALALIGVFGWIGHQALTTAHAHAPASTLAPFVYVQLLYMATSSWAVFGEPPDAWTLAGGAIVLASGLYVWSRERALAKRPSAAPGVAAQ